MKLMITGSNRRFAFAVAVLVMVLATGSRADEPVDVRPEGELSNVAGVSIVRVVQDGPEEGRLFGMARKFGSSMSMSGDDSFSGQNVSIAHTLSTLASVDEERVFGCELCPPGYFDITVEVSDDADSAFSKSTA